MWSTKTAPVFMPCEGAVGAERHLAQVVVVADAGEDDVCICAAAAAGVRRERAAVFGDPGLGLGAGAVVDGDVVALAS